MPLYDYQCNDEKCEHVFESFFTLADYQDEIPCPKCLHPATRRYFTHQRAAILGAPTVVFKDSEGKISFPGSAGEPTPQGCVRVELTTMKERREFAAHQDSVAREQYERRMEGESNHYNQVLHDNRAELASKLRTNYGRDFARVAAEQSNERLRKRYNQSYVPGSRFDIAE